jgi:hypothetical protein
MTQWRVLLDGDSNKVEPQLRDVEVTVNADPFGDNATAFVGDVAGQRADEYREGRRVDFQVRDFDTQGTYQTVLAGYVVQSRPRSEGAGDILEVECYSFDTLLRRNEMNGDLSGQSVSDALKDLVQNHIPGVTYDSNQVNVVNDVTVQRPFTHERVDNILDQLRQLSGNETFGVDETLTFFFRPAETDTISRGIGPGDQFGYDLPERASESLNEVQVFFDDGDRSVIVDDGGRKQDLKESLGASEPVTQAESIMREQIQTRAEAVRAGKRVLQDRSPTLSGTVETFGLLDASPGDTIPVTIPQRGINDEFLIAQLTYHIDDTVEVTILRQPDDAQKSTDPHADMLVRMSDSLQRVEMRPARGEHDLDRRTRLIETAAGVQLSVSGTVDGTPLSEIAVTGVGFDALKQALIDKSTLTPDAIAVGTDDTAPARSQTDLGNQSAETSQTSGTSSGPTATFDASFSSPGTGIVEVGLRQTSGGSDDILIRGILETPVDNPSSVSISVAVGDDPDRTETVLTTTGQTYLRDVLADNSPTNPDGIAVGTATSVTLDESDTSLDSSSPLFSRALGNEIVTEIDSGSEWRDETAIPADKPAFVDGSVVANSQAAFVFEAENNSNPNLSSFSDSSFSGGAGVTLSGSDIITFSFTPDHEITNPAVALRGRENTTSPDVSVFLQGSQSLLDMPGSLGWVGQSATPTLPAGETAAVQVGGTNSVDVDVDLVVVYDADAISKSVTNWDNANGGSSGYLDDPPLFADQTVFEAIGIALPRPATDITLGSSFNDTTGSQFVEVEGNAGVGTTRNTNSETVSTTLTNTTIFANARFGLSRFDDTTVSETPLKNNAAQTVDLFNIQLGGGGIVETGPRAVDYRTFTTSGQSSNNTLTEMAVRDTNGDTLTHSRLASVFIGPELSLEFNETWSLQRSPLAVNQADFDPDIVNSSVVNGGDTSGTDYFIVSIDNISSSF